jgi:hypothetical protein
VDGAAILGGLALIGSIAGTEQKAREAAPRATTRTTAAPSKYVHTWHKDDASTTCAEWSANMTPAQRFAGAADMLGSARAKDGATGLPSDALIEAFGRDVAEGCSVEAAAGGWRVDLPHRSGSVPPLRALSAPLSLNHV